MTDAELDELLDHCPRLFHMAEGGSWSSIRRHGLLSTSALLDLYDVRGKLRESIELSHRSESISIDAEDLASAVVRDQKPMSDRGLSRCLDDRLTPRDWYRLLNSKVFFWLTEERLMRLLGAKAYRDLEHDVIVVDSRSLVETHRDEILLCPINSGCTKPFPHPRGLSTFAAIPDYPYVKWKKKRRIGERVVELCVEGGVADISDHVVEVRKMSGSEILDTFYVKN